MRTSSQTQLQSKAIQIFKLSEAGWLNKLLLWYVKCGDYSNPISACNNKGGVNRRNKVIGSWIEIGYLYNTSGVWLGIIYNSDHTSSDARNVHRAAISSGLPRRPIFCLAMKALYA